MFLSVNMVILSRVVVPLLGLLVWICFYLDARLAYTRPRGWKRWASQLSLVAGAAAIFALQVNVMQHWAPADASGSYSSGFVGIECGGALVIGFWTLFHERAKSTKAKVTKQSGNNDRSQRS